MRWKPRQVFVLDEVVPALRARGVAAADLVLHVIGLPPLLNPKPSTLKSRP